MRDKVAQHEAGERERVDGTRGHGGVGEARDEGVQKVAALLQLTPDAVSRLRKCQNDKG